MDERNGGIFESYAMFPNVSGVGSGRGGRAPSGSIERMRVVRVGSFSSKSDSDNASIASAESWTDDEDIEAPRPTKHSKNSTVHKRRAKKSAKRTTFEDSEMDEHSSDGLSSDTE